MTVIIEHAAAATAAREGNPRALARRAGAGWPATVQDRPAVLARMSGAPFDTDSSGSHHRTSHAMGLALLLDWLEDQPGASWQDRWLASGADAGNGASRQVPLAWLRCAPT